MKNKTLPDKLSDLLELAVADAQKVAKKPGYKLNMAIWHEPLDDEKRNKELCQVCLAGSVMSCTLGLEKGDDMSPYDFDDLVLSDKLETINDMREGSIDFRNKASYIDDDRWSPFDAKDTRDYELAQDAMDLISDNFSDSLDGGRAPWGIYKRAAKMLRKAGF